MVVGGIHAADHPPPTTNIHGAEEYTHENNRSCRRGVRPGRRGGGRTGQQARADGVTANSYTSGTFMMRGNPCGTPQTEIGSGNVPALMRSMFFL